MRLQVATSDCAYSGRHLIGEGLAIYQSIGILIVNCPVQLYQRVQCIKVDQGVDEQGVDEQDSTAQC